MNSIHTKASAKINLCLEVVKKSDNGFHEIRSIMLKSEQLYDDVEVIFDEDTTDIIIVCDHDGVPTDQNNICYKVAHEYFEKIGQRVGMQIVITKRIPPLTGLGGGSSDGAVVLRALNAYFDHVLTSDAIIDIAATVGKDIPFFLQDSLAAEVHGSGERVEGIDDFPQLYILIVSPGGEIATQWAYGQLDKKLWFMDDVNRKNITHAMRGAIKDPTDITSFVYNDFAIVAEEKYPVIKEIQGALCAFGARVASISGKGPTVFGIFDTIKDREVAQKILQKKYPNFFITQY